MTLQSHLPFAEPEFLFEAVATTPLPCGNRVSNMVNPVKVKLEAPRWKKFKRGLLFFNP